MGGLAICRVNVHAAVAATGQAQYVLTYQGQPVGVLSPIDEQQLDALLVQAAQYASRRFPSSCRRDKAGEAVRRPTDEELTAELDELSQRIARHWKGRQTAVQVLSEMRD